MSGRALLVGAASLVVVPALAGGGGGHATAGGYIGPLPSSWFEDEPCHNGTITMYENFLVREYQVDVLGVAEDGDPNTYAKCTALANLQEMRCDVGLPDGTVIGCRDSEGPHALPRSEDVLYLQFDPGDVTSCNIVLGTGNTFGIADPKCRETTGSGGTTSTGGSTGSGGSTTAVCDATTASATLSTGQGTNIASNACVRLKNEGSWGGVNPLLMTQGGTAMYPVPFSYTWCNGTGADSLTGDWQTAYLMDGTGQAQANPGCDIFVQLQGDGSQVSFQYYQ